MTRQDAAGYLIILGTILAVCCLYTALDTPPQTIVADKPKAAVEVVYQRAELAAAAEPELVSLGEFTVYAYCDCPKCCGQWSGGPTASGTTPTVGRTAAADWDVLPAGTGIYIDGLGWRTVEDTGSGVNGRVLDVYMPDHQSALEWGKRDSEVWVYGR